MSANPGPPDDATPDAASAYEAWVASDAAKAAEAADAAMRLPDERTPGDGRTPGGEQRTPGGGDAVGREKGVGGRGPADGGGTGDGQGPPDGDERLPCGRSLHEVWGAWDEDGATGDPHYAQCPHCGAALDGLRVLDDFVRTTRTLEDEQANTEEAAAAVDRSAEAVTARVMDIVRRELRPGRSLPLGEPEEDAWIVEAAAAKTFRAAAETLPGVRAGSCRVLPLTPDSGTPPGTETETGTGTARAPEAETGTAEAPDSGTGTGMDSATGSRPHDPSGRHRAAGQSGESRGPLRVRLEVAADIGMFHAVGAAGQDAGSSVPEIAQAVRDRVMAAARDAVGLDVRTVDVAVIDLLHGPGGADGETRGRSRW